MSRYEVSLTHFPIRTEMQSLHPTLANAIASARQALDHAYQAYLSPQAADVIINSQIDVFDGLLEQGDWLSDAFLEAANSVLEDLMVKPAHDNQNREKAVHKLREAIDLTQRIRDLLTADRAIKAFKANLQSD